MVLDLGAQPACDYFPAADDAGPDPTYPLQMWLCAECGLAQLVDDPTVPDEPKATEPAALVAQAADAVGRVAAAGWLTPHSRAAEYGSPHGGSWLSLLQDRGLNLAADGEPAEVVLDCFGLMHGPDQAAVVAERTARVAPGGVLLLQYHSLATIIARAQWTSLRHGHFAYYSTTALSGLLERAGFVSRAAWQFELYGGTVLLAATAPDVPAGNDGSVEQILADERRLGVTDPAVVGGLQREVDSQAGTLRNWLVSRRSSGRSVLAYGAASRAVALLGKAGVGRDLLAAVADASPAKQGSRMPGTDIPIIDPAELIAARPDDVLLLLPDLLDEVRSKLPGVEATGGQWVNVEDLVAGRLGASKWPVVEGIGNRADQEH